MRSCKPFATQSSRDDINECRAEMDEAETPAALFAFESALIRSEEEENVLSGLDYLANNQFDQQDQKIKTVYLKALGLYRLKKDDECLKVIQEAKDQGVSSTEIEQIKSAIIEEKKEKKEKAVAAGVGIGASIVVGIAAIAAIIFGAKSKKK